MRDIKGLLESVSVDNRGAFERFYNLYYDQVFRFAYYCLGEKEACREVVTDVFFSVWQSRKRLKDIDNIDTYLYISVRNESFRFQARNKDLNRVSLNELLPLMEEEDEGSPEEHLELKEMTEILSVQESTVRVQMKIAIEKLVARLKPSFPNISFSLLLMFIFNVIYRSA